jgi:hypothetical protein
MTVWNMHVRAFRAPGQPAPDKPPKFPPKWPPNFPPNAGRLGPHSAVVRHAIAAAEAKGGDQ